MKTWEKGPPVDSGLFVIEWMNGGGYAVFEVRDHDGILYAYSCEGMNHDRCTRLSKWAIKRHLRIAEPNFEEFEEALASPTTTSRTWTVELSEPIKARKPAKKKARCT